MSSWTSWAETPSYPTTARALTRKTLTACSVYFSPERCEEAAAWACIFVVRI